MVAEMESIRVIDIKKHTNLRHGDTVTSQIASGYGEITDFQFHDGKLYLALDGNVIKFEPFYLAEFWKRRVLPYVRKQVHSNYKLLENFPSRLYGAYKLAAEATNKEAVNKQAISVSKTARNHMGYINDDRGSVWTDCTDDDMIRFRAHLKGFVRDVDLKDVEERYGISRMSKAQIQLLSAGETYSMLYFHKLGFTYEKVDCVKVNDGDQYLSWNEVGMPMSDICHQDMDMINEDGSFEPSHGAQNEDGYLFVENGMKRLIDPAVSETQTSEIVAVEPYSDKDDYPYQTQRKNI